MTLIGMVGLSALTGWILGAAVRWNVKIEAKRRRRTRRRGSTLY